MKMFSSVIRWKQPRISVTGNRNSSTPLFPTPNDFYEERPMTLKEAYEQMRKEVLSLRRENKKLKEGTYIDADRAANEKQIRHLLHQVEILTKERDRYHELWQYAVKHQASSIDDLVRIEDLENENHDLEETIASLQAALQEANNTIAKQKIQMNRDHENSSIPSSKERFSKKVKNSRLKTGRKPGAQPNHPGHKRPKMQPTEPTVIIPVPSDIINDPDYYLTGKMIRKQVIDINVQVSIKEYATYEYRSRSTGKRGHAEFPDGLSNEFNYGENAKALAFLLNNYCNVSIDKTQELISGLSNGQIILSKGLISNLKKQFSDKTTEDRSRIFDRLLLAPTMYSDATPGKVNGKTIQVIVCANDDEMLYFFREHKGFDGLRGTPVEEYTQTLVHDHDKTYYHYGSGHQECLAHVQRYLQDSIENEPDLTWNTAMKEFLSDIIHLRNNQSNQLSEEQILDAENKYDKIIRLGEKEYLLHPPSKYYPDGYNLWKRMKEYREAHLFFLRHPDVDATNNLSERSLRKFKRKMHQAVAFRSNESVEQLCNCMSILETSRIYDANIFQISREVFAR